MAMNKQKTRWMLMGWLGRAAQLARLSSFTTYEREDPPGKPWIESYLTDRQSMKPLSAVNLIQEVCDEIREDKGTDK